MRLVIAALLMLAVCHPAAAQVSGGTNIRVALVAEDAPKPGRNWTVALHFTPRTPEWHGYWSNPGDAGVGMTMQWRLPPGWRAGAPLYPVPQTLTIAGLMNHVFEGDHAVLVPISVPAGAAIPGEISLDLAYLACTDAICVPERARLRLDPSRVSGDTRFDRWRAALAPPLDRTVRFAVTGDRLRLAIPLPEALSLPKPHVFVETRDLVAYAGVQGFARAGDTLVAEVPLVKDAAAPQRIAGIFAFGDGGGVRFEGRQGAVPDAEITRAAPDGTSVAAVWLALGGAFLGGLILNLMPCVFPILSLKALALARAGGAERRARREALAYTAGVVLACLVLGALLLLLRAGGAEIGWAFQLQEPGVVAALLVLAVLITANFLGLFFLPAPSIAGKGGGTSAFATGALAAVAATPCTGPFMAGALGAALLLPAPQAMGLFAALGLGLAFPFLLLGFVPRLRAMLPKPGAWMATFQRWMALPMGLTALALAWLAWRMGGPAFVAGCVALAALLIVALRVPRVSARAGGFALAVLLGAVALPRLYATQGVSADGGLLAARPFSQAALAEARAGGKPVFVWFTADWCLTCKVNERAAIERDSTRAAFERTGVIALRGDWTRRDAAITRYLTAQGAAGVPLYQWFPAGGGPPRQLPQVLTPALLAELAHGTAGPDQRAPGSD